MLTPCAISPRLVQPRFNATLSGMPLQDLPTELDIKILSYLDDEDLACVTRVSKYYRKIGEPILYATIYLWEHEDYRIKQLLLTLLHRHDLCGAMRTFRLYNRSRPAHDERRNLEWPDKPLDPTGSDVGDSLWRHMTYLRDALDGLLGPHALPTELKLTWHGKILEPYPSFDGALALLLCLATRLTDVYLEITWWQHLPMTMAALERVNWYNHGGEQIHQPFQELRTLTMSGYHSDPVAFDPIVLPTITDLVVDCNSLLKHFRLADGLQTGPVALRVLELRRVNFDPAMLEELVGSSHIRHLERLEVFEIGHAYDEWGDESDRKWWQYDYRRLKQAMLTHLPELRVFTWANMDFPGDLIDIKPFGSFVDFPNLTSLRVVYPLLFNASGEEYAHQSPPALSSLCGIFPSGLESLTICQLEWSAFLDDFKTKRDNEIAQSVLLQRLQGFSTNIQAKKITVEFDMGDTS
jgi:hypothetical protein